MSERSIMNLVQRPKDGHLLMGSYSLYLSQLLFLLTQESTNWRIVVSQIVVFICIILSREYKKKSSNTADIGVGSDIDSIPPNQPIE